jgi:dynein heavy chain 1
LKGIPLAKKKIAELDLALLHLLQNVEIPEITLQIPNLVQNAIAQVPISHISSMLTGARPRPKIFVPQ